MRYIIIAVRFQFDLLDNDDSLLCMYLQTCFTNSVEELNEYIANVAEDAADNEYNDHHEDEYNVIYGRNYAIITKKMLQELELVRNSIYYSIEKFYSEGFRPVYGRTDHLGDLLLTMEK
jgi:hypothetical protein